MVAIDLRVLAGAVADRLTPLTTGTAAAEGYIGTVGRTLAGALDVDPQPKSKQDPRVRPYFVVFPGIGGPGAEQSLADCLVDLDVPFPVTVAGGDIDDVLSLASRVHDQLHRWAPGVLGTSPDVFVSGPLRVPAGYSAPLLTDQQFKPARLYVPLQYVLTAHT